MTTPVNNLFDKKACDESPFPLNSIDQAFDELFWTSSQRSKVNTGWLDCAKYGENTYFVNDKFTNLQILFLMRGVGRGRDRGYLDFENDIKRD
jgi:hypothetical protein